MLHTKKNIISFICLCVFSGTIIEAEEIRLRPVTPNLQERGELALNFLTRLSDPEQDYLPYFWGRYNYDKPALWHEEPIVAQTVGLWTDALVLARLMTGSDFNEHIDPKIYALLRTSFNEEDGLLQREDSWAQAPTGIVQIDNTAYALKGLVTLYDATRDEQLKNRIDRTIHSLCEIVIKKEGYWYFPTNRYYRDRGWPTTDEPPLTGWPCPFAIHCVRYLSPLAHYVQITGNPEAKELLENLINWIVFYSGIKFGVKGDIQGFLCTGTWTANALLLYGRHAKRGDLIDWAEKVYQYCARQGTRFGWFPEFVSNYSGEGGETCPLVDMINIAIMLALEGKENYWNDVERYGRNQLLEHQMVRTDWINRIRPTTEIRPGQPPHAYIQDDVLDRVRGTFSIWSAPNDFFGPSSVGGSFMRCTCCDVQGTRGLYLLWHYAVTKKQESVYVNLLFSRDTQWAQIDSFLPYQGKVAVRIIDAENLYIRVPDWANRSEVSATLNDSDIPLSWQGTFVKFSSVKKGDTASVSFPVPIKKERENIKTWGYEIEWKGDTVLAIDPPGTLYPLYQREDFRRPSAPLKNDLHYSFPEREISP